MTKLLFNLTWKEKGAPSVLELCEKLGFKPEEIDERFGVIEIDPEERLYTILAEADAVNRVRSQTEDPGADLEGPYANVSIAPFGPPEES